MCLFPHVRPSPFLHTHKVIFWSGGRKKKKIALLSDSKKRHLLHTAAPVAPVACLGSTITIHVCRNGFICLILLSHQAAQGCSLHRGSRLSAGTVAVRASNMLNPRLFPLHACHSSALSVHCCCQNISLLRRSQTEKNVHVSVKQILHCVFLFRLFFFLAHKVCLFCLFFKHTRKEQEIQLCTAREDEMM